MARAPEAEDVRVDTYDEILRDRVTVACPCCGCGVLPDELQPCEGCDAPTMCRRCAAGHLCEVADE